MNTGRPVRANCPRCADIKVALHSVTVVRAPDVVAVTCPTCAQVRVVPISRALYDEFLIAGARPTNRPLEADEPRPSGAHFTMRDAVAFVYWLADDKRVAVALEHSKETP